MRISICIGSSCHLKGSHSVVETLTSRVKKDGLEDKITLAGRFCMGNCDHGVCVTIDGVDGIFSVQPDNVDKFFEDEVLTRL